MKWVSKNKDGQVGFWWPDSDRFLPEKFKNNNTMWTNDGMPDFQHISRFLGLSQVEEFDVAFDIGAHVGLWSIHLAKLFKKVYAPSQKSKQKKSETDELTFIIPIFSTTSIAAFIHSENSIIRT